MGDHILPFVEDLLRALPNLWQRAEGSSLVRIQVGWGVLRVGMRGGGGR